jgi:hypothetical protein
MTLSHPPPGRAWAEGKKNESVLDGCEHGSRFSSHRQSQASYRNYGAAICCRCGEFCLAVSAPLWACGGLKGLSGSMIDSPNKEFRRLVELVLQPLRTRSTTTEALAIQA